MYWLIDFAVALGVAIAPTRSLLASFRDPISYEKRYLRSLRFIPLREDMRRSSLYMLLGGAAFGWTAWRAHLTYLWSALCPIFLLLGFVTVLVSLARPVKRLHDPESPPPTDATLGRRRLVTQAIQVLFLTLWVYSWRGLAA
jgi:hypothetical protein